jgi:hypothetical protein
VICLCLCAAITSVSIGLGLSPGVTLVAVAVADIFTGGERARDRFLLFTAVVFGVVPVFGWVELPLWIDPLAGVSAIWLVLLVRGAGHSGTGKLSNLPDLLPVGAAGWFSYQWWSGLDDGSPAQVLERLLPVWDSSAHFNFFLMNLRHGAYISRLAGGPDGLGWYGVDYPTGLHYVWSRFLIDSQESITANSALAIPVFANSIVLTVAFSAAVISFSVMRVGNASLQRFAFGATGAGLAVGLLTVGPISQTIYAGFVNIPPVLMGLAIIGSYTIRPMGKDVAQSVVLAGAVLMVVYNWYPAVLLAVPVLILHLVRLGRAGNWRIAVLVGIPTGVLAALPVVQTLSLGVKHLEVQGGVQALPPGILVAVLLSCLAIPLANGGVRAIEIALCSPPAVLLLALGLRLRLTTGQYPYYFHKASLFVAAFAAFVIVICLAGRVARRTGELSTSWLNSISMVTGSVILGLGVSQVFGYWGPDYPTFSAGNTAAGVLTRNELMKGASTYLPLAEAIIREADNINNLTLKERSCSTLLVPTRLAVDDSVTNGPWMGTLANVWFHALSDSYTLWAQSQAYMTVNVAHAMTDEKLLVDEISRVFDRSSVCIVSTRQVVEELERRNPDWSTRSLLQG